MWTDDGRPTTDDGRKEWIGFHFPKSTDDRRPTTDEKNEFTLSFRYWPTKDDGRTTNDEIIFPFFLASNFWRTDERRTNFPNSSVLPENANIPKKLDIDLDIAVLDIFLLDKADIGHKSLGHEKLDILVVLRSMTSAASIWVMRFYTEFL